MIDPPHKPRRPGNASYASVALDDALVPAMGLMGNIPPSRPLQPYEEDEADLLDVSLIDHWALRRLHRMGRARATLVVWALGTLSAMAATALVLFMLHVPMDEWRLALIVAAIVPIAVAPPCVQLIMALFAHLDAACRRVAETATRDEVTGVFNHRHFLDRARLEWKRAGRGYQFISVLMIDIDRMAEVNAKHGEPFGDLVLRRVARRCTDSLRATDLVARHGGEKFVVLLPDTDAGQAERLSERVRHDIARLDILTHRGAVTSVTVSAGVATWRGPLESMEFLIARADRALFTAKLSGRNRVCASVE